MARKTRLIRIAPIKRGGAIGAFVAGQFDARGHARFSHRHYLIVARHARDGGTRAAALTAAAVWRRRFGSAA